MAPAPSTEEEGAAAAIEAEKAAEAAISQVIVHIITRSRASDSESETVFLASAQRIEFIERLEQRPLQVQDTRERKALIFCVFRIATFPFRLSVALARRTSHRGTTYLKWFYAGFVIVVRF